MSDLLVDTDVFSFLFKRDSRASAYARLVETGEPSLCFMSVAELKRWAIERRWGTARKAALNEAFRHYAILPFERRLTDIWAEIAAHRASIGRPIECGDCWIAATAVRHGLPLVTHNASHYIEIPGLQVLTHSSKS